MQPKTIIQAISRWENVLIEMIAISVIFISAAVTANYFGWPSSDLTVKAAAAVYAFGVDGMFYMCVRLARHFLSSDFSIKRVSFGLFWLGLSLLMGAFTWHNNLLFAANSWHISAEALQRVGISDAQELQLHAIIPVAVVLIVAVIPRRKAKDERTPEQILEDAQREIALAEAKNQVRAAKAGIAGAGLRGTLLGFAGQALNLEERQRQQAEQEAQRAEERQHAAALEEERRQMRLLATLEELNAASDDEGDLDYELLYRVLREAGKWPPAIAALPDVPTLQQKALDEEAEEQEAEEANAMTASGKHKVWMTAEDVAKELGIPASQAELRMRAGYRGRYRPIKSQEFKLARGKRIRKAHFEIVGHVKAKEQEKQQQESHAPTKVSRQRKTNGSDEAQEQLA